MFGQAASSSAAAASTKTDKLSGALTPKENVIARAKSVSKPQLAPSDRATPDSEKKCETQSKLGDGGKDGQSGSKGNV